MVRSAFPRVRTVCAKLWFASGLSEDSSSPGLARDHQPAIAARSPRSYLFAYIATVGEEFMTWISEVYGQDDPVATPYVRLDVLPMPSDPARAAGMVRMDDPHREHQVGSHRSNSLRRVVRLNPH